MMLFGPGLPDDCRSAAGLLWELWSVGAVVEVGDDGKGLLLDAGAVTVDQRQRMRDLAPQVKQCIRRLEAETARRREEMAQA